MTFSKAENFFVHLYFKSKNLVMIGPGLFDNVVRGWRFVFFLHHLLQATFKISFDNSFFLGQMPHNKPLSPRKALIQKNGAHDGFINITKQAFSLSPSRRFFALT